MNKVLSNRCDSCILALQTSYNLQPTTYVKKFNILPRNPILKIDLFHFVKPASEERQNTRLSRV